MKGFTALDGDGAATGWGASWGWPWTPPTCAICQAHFRDRERRDPTLTEIRLLDTYWSDHCRHTTFLTAIERVAIAAGAWNEPVRRAYRRLPGGPARASAARAPAMSA